MSQSAGRSVGRFFPPSFLALLNKLCAKNNSGAAEVEHGGPHRHSDLPRGYADYEDKIHDSDREQKWDILMLVVLALDDGRDRGIEQRAFLSSLSRQKPDTTHKGMRGRRAASAVQGKHKREREQCPTDRADITRVN